MISTTCWTFPRGELSWQPPAGLLGAGIATAFAVVPAAPAGAAHAGAIGYNARSNAVPMAKAWRCQVAQALAPEPFLFQCVELRWTFTWTSWSLVNKLKLRTCTPLGW